MMDKLVLNCPRCGKVEGYFPSEEGEDQPPGTLDEELEEQVFESVHGPKTRVRCPKCGQWLSPDREQASPD